MEEWFFSPETSEDTLDILSVADPHQSNANRSCETMSTLTGWGLFGARTADVSQDRTARSQHAAPVRKPQAWHFKLQKLKDRPGPSDLGGWGCWRFRGISPPTQYIQKAKYRVKSYSQLSKFIIICLVGLWSFSNLISVFLSISAFIMEMNAQYLHHNCAQDECFIVYFRNSQFSTHVSYQL